MHTSHTEPLFLPLRRWLRAGRRRGFSLIELIAVIVLAGLLGTLVVGTLLAQLRLARAAGERVLDADAQRTATAILQGELRRMVSSDLRVLSADSISMRAFRGTAFSCGVISNLVTVRYRGDRLPDPTKDSVLVIGADGASHTSGLVDSRPSDMTGCTVQPGEAVLQWRLVTPGVQPAVLLIFESGRYYLTGRALRYRLGREGRQPLTAEAFLHPATQFLDMRTRAVRFSLQVDERVLQLHTASFSPPPNRP